MFDKANKKAQAEKAQAADNKPAAQTSAPAAAPTGGNVFPLFFTKPIAVSSDRHAEAGIQLNLPPEFARGTNSMPISIMEFIEAAKYYPIAFTTGDQPTPIAIVGLEQENLFLASDGKWRQDVYIPAYVRKHPFVFAEDPSSDTLTLCVDEDSPYFMKNAKGDNTVRFFEGDKPTAYTNDVLAFCKAFHEQFLLTRQFCAILKELDLLEPNRSDIELPSGRKIALGGFQLIDQKKFEQLPEAKIYELHKQGWLPLIHYTFLSLSNWRRLLDLAALRERN